MHGAEYDELSETVEKYKDKFESVKIAEPLLGEVGADATVINADKEAVAKQSQTKQLRQQTMTALMQQPKMEPHLYSWDMELHTLQM